MFGKNYYTPVPLVVHPSNRLLFPLSNLPKEDAHPNSCFGLFPCGDHNATEGGHVPIGSLDVLFDAQENKYTMQQLALRKQKAIEWQLANAAKLTRVNP